MKKKDNFEEKLLTELRQVVSERPEPAHATAQPHRSRRPARFAMAGGGLAVAVAAVAIIAGSGDNTPTAYAVAKEPDGAVTVSIKSLQDADGLEASLIKAGVPAEVNYSPVMPTVECTGDLKGSAAARLEPSSRVKPNETVRVDSLSTKASPTVPADSASVTSDGPAVSSGSAGGPGGTDASSGPEGTTFTIDPKVIKDGDKVFITTSTESVPATPTTPAGETLDETLTKLDTAKIAMSIGKEGQVPGC